MIKLQWFLWNRYCKSFHDELQVGLTCYYLHYYKEKAATPSSGVKECFGNFFATRLSGSWRRLICKATAPSSGKKTPLHPVSFTQL